MVSSHAEPAPQFRNCRALSIGEDAHAKDFRGPPEKDGNRGDGDENRQQHMPHRRLGCHRAREHRHRPKHGRERKSDRQRRIGIGDNRKHQKPRRHHDHLNRGHELLCLLVAVACRSGDRVNANVRQVSEDEKDEEGEGRALPEVAEGQLLKLDNIRPEQHFTEPPPRYNDATLVKELEEDGIGRPSTYAAIISTLVEREYVTKDQGRFSPTMLGERVCKLLVKSFEDIFDLKFTARMEEELDEIEDGKLPWRESVKEFWEKFVLDLDKADEEMLSYKAGIPTGKKCEKCGQGELLERISRHGFFLGCSRYPDCDFIEDLSPLDPDAGDENKTHYCDNCGKEMAIKRGRFGTFLACTGYPDCKTTRRLVQGTRIAHRPDEPLDEKCPTCGNGLVKKHGRFGEFIGCSAYPKCKYTRPITMGIKCPKCHEGEFVRRGSAGKGGRGRPRIFYGCSRYPDCDFTTPHMPIAEPCPKCGAPFIVEKRTKIGTVHACLKEGCDWEKLAPEVPPATQPEEAPVPVAAKS